MSRQSGFLEFKLDYSATKNLAIGAVVSSKDISAGGHIWRVNCYPRGTKQAEDHGEYLSVVLQLVSKSKNVKAIFDVFVMKKDGNPSSSHAQRCVHVYPPEGFVSWGFAQFVKRSDLESLYVTNGSVTIMCGVIVLCDYPLDLDVPSSDIGMHLGRLLNCTDSSDVSFVVDAETFPAHRAVLAARSPVFKAQLCGSMAEAKMSSIVLHNIDASTFKVMLHFIYTDALPPADDKLGDFPAEMFERLLAAADLYQLDRLKLMCARKLWNDVSVDTVAATLACAETYSCSGLKKKCITFLADEKNFRDAVLTDGFVQLVQKFPSIITEIKEAGK